MQFSVIPTKHPFHSRGMAEWEVKTRSFSRDSTFPNDPILTSPIFSRESAQRHQKEFESFETEILSEWKTNAANALKYYMESDTLSVVMAYCEPAVADYHWVYKREDNQSKPSKDIHPKVSDFVELLRHKGRFGDIIQVELSDGCDAPHGPCYAVDDLRKGSLFNVKPTMWMDVDIPTRITDDLCDPIQFYRFCAPIQGLQHLRRIEFSFDHPYIQRLLSINPRNKKDLDHKLLTSWRYYFEQQNISQFMKFRKNVPKSFPQHPKIMNIITDSGQQVKINLPTSFTLFKILTH